MLDYPYIVGKEHLKPVKTQWKSNKSNIWHEIPLDSDGLIHLPKAVVYVTSLTFKLTDAASNSSFYYIPALIQ